MPRRRLDDMECGVAQTLDHVGDWWTLLIVRDDFFDKTRFSEKVKDVFEQYKEDKEFYKLIKDIQATQ